MLPLPLKYWLPITWVEWMRGVWVDSDATEQLNAPTLVGCTQRSQGI